MHPLMFELGMIHTRRKLRKEGRSYSDINDALAGVTAKTVEAALPEGTVLPTFSQPAIAEGAVGVFGDGHIIKAIEDFFQTPLGQLILKIIEMIAMSFFTV